MKCYKFFYEYSFLLFLMIFFRDGQKITSIEAEENLSNTDFKKTLKLTWLADIEEAPFVPCVCVYFDHIISKPVLGKDEDFKQFINPNTRVRHLFKISISIFNII